FVHGPALDADLSTSHELFKVMASGVYPATPKIRFPVAHVHDVAAAHAEALFRQEAAGQRYLIGEGQLGLYDLGRIMAAECPDLASKAPKFELPDVAVRALAVVDKRMRTVLPELGQKKLYSNEKARTALGLALKDATTAARDSVTSLRALGVI
ncbi:MAG: aldehyde reductase, partial [Hyphomicrobium sp.]